MGRLTRSLTANIICIKLMNNDQGHFKAIKTALFLIGN